MSSKTTVLIIEDSTAVCMLLTEYVKKLGYDDVKTTTTGHAGVSLFKEIIENKITPLIFLDYNLPDSNAKSIMSQILTIKPNTKIIIETANSKDEDSIKEVIGLGAYHYIQKPLHFNEIKKIITMFEEEESILDGSFSQKSKGRIDGYKIIDSFLSNYKRASISRLSEQSQLSEDDVLTYVKTIESAGNVVALNNIREICCNSCGSLSLAQIFQCPSCENSKFEQTKLIEHFDCGNVSEGSKYVDEKCPKCKKEIKALGVDYKILPNHYLCNKCEALFPELTTIYQCLKCEHRFNLSDANWKESPLYKVT